jgi:1,2-diacylglycerol 3-alpha-glucosyltransferase
MKIAIIGQTYGHNVNGAAVFSKRLAEGLSGAGQEVSVFTPSLLGHAEAAHEAGVTIHEVTSFSLAPFYPEVHIPVFNRAQIGDLLDDVRPDVVHIQDHYPLSTAGLREARARGIPCLATNHFLPPNLIRQVSIFKPFRGLAEAILWRSIRRVMNRADLVTTPSRFGMRMLVQHRVKRPVQAVSCGVDRTRFKPLQGHDRRRTLEKYGLDPEHFVLLYVGRIDEDKELEQAIEAMKYLTGSGVQLALAGHGHVQRALRQQARQEGALDFIRFPGFIPATDLVPLLNSADAFIMPSDIELLSIATLEAMACGLPVIGADAGALPELVRDGVNGYLFQPGDPTSLARAVRKLTENRRALADFSAHSLQIAAEHDLRDVISDYLLLYEELTHQDRDRIRR